jgi:hypothetical protein
MRIRRLIASWDFLAGFTGFVSVWLFAGKWVGNEFAKDVYGVGITVLSIVFSVYFAALAIIMSSSDDDFVEFLEQEGDFTAIITAFEDALYVLFGALVYSLALYAYTGFRLSKHVQHQGWFFIAVFTFAFFWGLVGALCATRDSIIYSRFRARFVLARRKTNVGHGG